MPAAEKYEVLILGSGEAGKYLAWTSARAGKRTALIERRYIGGSCPNIACLPSKNVIHSAKVTNYFQRAEEFGIECAGWSVDMAGVRARKRRMVDDMVAIHRGHYESSGAELVMGEGRFVAPRTIETALLDGGTRTLEGERVILSTGSRTSLQSLPGLVEARPMTHIDLLELDTVPGHLLVLGGGYIGLELAQAMRRFGSRVTVIERNDRLLPREDADVSELLTGLCAREGIALATGTSIERVSGISGDRVSVSATRNGAPVTIEGTHLLVATGRTPNTDGIGLETAGVKLDSRGYIEVNERLETTAEATWAVGDCAGSPHFTHIAFDDYRIVRDNLAGGKRVTTGRLVPFCMFTDPEFARVGLSETEAKSQGIPYRLVKVPMAAVLRAHTVAETQGFMKALLDAESDRILGFTAVGADAGETISVVQLAIANGIPYTAIRDSVFTHPTMAEGLTVLFAGKPVSAT